MNYFTTEVISAVAVFVNNVNKIAFKTNADSLDDDSRLEHASMEHEPAKIRSTWVSGVVKTKEEWSSTGNLAFDDQSRGASGVL